MHLLLNMLALRISPTQTAMLAQTAQYTTQTAQYIQPINHNYYA